MFLGIIVACGLMPGPGITDSCAVSAATSLTTYDECIANQTEYMTYVFGRWEELYENGDIPKMPYITDRQCIKVDLEPNV